MRVRVPSPTLSPTDPAPRGLLTRALSPGGLGGTGQGLDHVCLLPTPPRPPYSLYPAPYTLFPLFLSLTGDGSSRAPDERGVAARFLMVASNVVCPVRLWEREGETEGGGRENL